ncbi:Protein of unknown function [Pyronema omphalodes CBS 100304]|uniref:Uncharacterized protein n=1 Tax=Pyronema omphalodes (strain CBS 100304) TaxID=1076935 RepID=U4LKM9_PYROM|nr:Protein of unknown function [Pyronema omphalodes CBS 100304]
MTPFRLLLVASIFLLTRCAKPCLKIVHGAQLPEMASRWRS